MYTPLKEIIDLEPVNYPPVPCKTCQSILNPYCPIDFRQKTWSCSICATINHFPSHYASNINETALPYELMADYSTLEYIVPNKSFTNQENARPIFMLVIDTAIPSDELVELKDSLQ